MDLWKQNEVLYLQYKKDDKLKVSTLIEILQDAMNFCGDRDIVFYDINEDKTIEINGVMNDKGKICIFK